MNLSWDNLLLGELAVDGVVETEHDTEGDEMQEDKVEPQNVNLVKTMLY